MEEQHQSIDEIFRQSLGDYREAPPAAAWDGVAARLDNDEGRQRRGFFMRWPWISLLLLLLVGGVWFITAQYGNRPDRNTAQMVGSDADYAAATDPSASGNDAPATLPGDRAIPDAPGTNNDPSDNTSAGPAAPVDAPTTGSTPPSAPAAQAQSVGARNTTAGSPASSAKRDRNAAASRRESATNIDPLSPSDNANPASGASNLDKPARTRRAANKSAGEAPPSRSRATGIATAADEEAYDAAQNPGAAPRLREAGDPDMAAPRNASGRNKTAKDRYAAQSPGDEDAAAPGNNKVDANRSGRRQKAAADNPAASRQAAGSGTASPGVASAVNAGPDASVNTPASAKADGARRNRQALPKAATAGKNVTPAETGTSSSGRPIRPVGDKNAAKNTSSSTASTAKGTSLAPKADKTPLPAATPVVASEATAPRPAAAEPASGRKMKVVEETPPSIAKTSPRKEAAPTPPANAVAQVPPGAEPPVGKWQPVAQAAEKARTDDEVGADNDPAEESTKGEKNEAGAGGGAGAGAAAGSNKAKTSMSLSFLAGYEFALQKPAPNNVTGGFRLLWHFDPAIAIGIQPSIRYGNVSMTALTESTAYQRNGAVSVDSVIRLDSAGFVNYRAYGLSQKMDSIIVSGIAASGPMWQFELPLILSYKIAKAWHVYGGPSAIIGGKLSTTAGGMQTYSTTRIDSVKSAGTILAPRPVASFQNHFSKSSLPDISTYTPEEDVLGIPATLRFGYLVGVGYEWKRVIVDLSLHQQVSGFSDVHKSVRNAYSSPNVRISIGYSLFPQKNAGRPAPIR